MSDVFQVHVVVCESDKTYNLKFLPNISEVTDLHMQPHALADGPHFSAWTPPTAGLRAGAA